MTSPDRGTTADAPVAGFIDRFWRTAIPWRSPKFWTIQVSILVIMTTHTLVLSWRDGTDLEGIPAPLTSSLMLIPVLYAALNFGTTGAIWTTTWATALFALHWLTLHHHDITSAHLWIELVSLAVLAVSGVIVGERVDVERLGRRRTEAALKIADLAEVRYRGLFEHQPAPVVIVTDDDDGVVVELNTAAQELLGPGAQGKALEASLGIAISDLLARRTPVAVRSPHGLIRHYMPSAHHIGVPGGPGLAQIVLADVSEEHQRREDQRAFTGRILEIQEEERLRLSRELHDDPLQQLTFLTRTLDEIAEDPALAPHLIGPVRDGLLISGTASAALRALIHGLRPPVLDDLGLVSALRQLTETVQPRGHLTVTLRVKGQAARLPADLELTAYRVVQEALNNVVKHANARHATVAVTFGTQLAVSVRDDGQGMSTATEEHGLGLVGIRERVDRAGGSMSIRSHPETGTEISVSLPTVSGTGADASRAAEATDVSSARGGEPRPGTRRLPVHLGQDTTGS